MYIYLQRFLEATDIIVSALCANVLNDFLRFGDQPEYSILLLRFFAKWSTSFLFHLQSEVAINQGFFHSLHKRISLYVGDFTAGSSWGLL